MSNITRLTVVAAALLGSLTQFANATKMADGKKPNIIMIMTDDQDLLMDSLSYQPKVQQHFREQGTFFEKHYCTIAQCCPSRVSLLTGKAAHNTNVTDIRAPFGGYSKFVEEGLNGQWLPTWFQESGYNTYYVGKLMNNHSTTNFDKPYPRGFTGTDFLLDPDTYIYYNATMQSNQQAPRKVTGQYSTDVIASRAVDFMGEAAASDEPFFLTVAPIGPHGETWFPRTYLNNGNLPIFQPPVAADKYKDLHRGAKVPRTPSYNAALTGGASYLKSLPEWNQTVIDYYDEFYRLRLATLASIDDLIESVIGKAEELDILDNTYIIYTTDNGFHIGQHRLPAGKTCAFEEDINIPFFIRGPNVAKGAVVDHPTSHTDLAPTLFQLAGIPLRDDFDGIPMPVLPETNQVHKLEHVNVEFWGDNFAEGKYATSILPQSNNNTYKSVRLISDDGTFNLLYVVWCTNEREMYEMNADPAQTKNLAVDFNQALSLKPRHIFEKTSTTSVPNYSDPKYLVRLQARLDTLLMVLKTCKGKTCAQPWHVMHLDGSVNSLKDAMDSKYDCFYTKMQPKVQYTACLKGYIRAVEGPGEGDVVAYQPGQTC